MRDIDEIDDVIVIGNRHQLPSALCKGAEA
jgi:hypothetical protein